MRVWAYAAAVGVAGAVSGGGGGFLDVSTGSHEITGGETLEYVIARGDAQLIVSGGNVSDFVAVPLSGGYASSSYGFSDALAGLVSGGQSRVIMDGGSAISAMAIGTSDLWVGPAARLTSLYSHENATLTVQGDTASPLYGVDAYGDSRVLYREGACERGLEAWDSSFFIVTGGVMGERLRVRDRATGELFDGAIAGDLVCQDEGRVLITGGTVSGHLVLEGTGDATVEGGRLGGILVQDTAHAQLFAGVIENDVACELSDAGVRASFDVRLVSYDHDDDPATPNIELEFDAADQAVVIANDPRFTTSERGEGATSVGEMRRVRVRWNNGEETTFDLRAEWSGESAAGSIVFQRIGIAEDLNGDGGIDVLDLALFLTSFGSAGGPADFNGDGLVDVLDLVRFLQAWENER